MIWTGSDDGLVHVTRDGGASWKNATPPEHAGVRAGQDRRVGVRSAGKAYLSVLMPLLDGLPAACVEDGGLRGDVDAHRVTTRT